MLWPLCYAFGHASDKRRLLAMMTKEELAQIIVYCDENKTSC